MYSFFGSLIFIFLFIQFCVVVPITFPLLLLLPQKKRHKLDTLEPDLEVAAAAVPEASQPEHFSSGPARNTF